MTVAVPAPVSEAAQPAGSALGSWPPGQPYPPRKVTGLGRIVHLIATRPAWLAPLALLACFGLSVAYVDHFNPTTGEPGPTGGCAFKTLTGLDCPGCGGTRAFYYLVHGNLPEAARNHVIAVFAAPFLVYMYVSWSVNRIFGTKLPRLRISPATLGAFMGAWLAFAILRDLPWAPFTHLFV